MTLFHCFSINMFLTKQINQEEERNNNNNEKEKKNKKEKKRKEKCKIKNVNNFALRLKIEMIFIIFHQMFYSKSIKIITNNFLT